MENKLLMDNYYYYYYLREKKKERKKIASDIPTDNYCSGYFSTVSYNKVDESNYPTHMLIFWHSFFFIF